MSCVGVIVFCLHTLWSLFNHQDAKNTQKYSAQFMKCLLSLFNVCSSTDDYQKKSHKGDGRACPLVRPCKLTRIHRYVQSFWAGSVCNLLLPFLPPPYNTSSMWLLTNIMGMCRNSAFVCLFFLWHKLVCPLHFSPDRTQ